MAPPSSPPNLFCVSDVYFEHGGASAMNTSIYHKYIGTLTCAYKEDVYVDDKGVARISAKRTKEREKYLFRGFGNKRDPILIECPPDLLAIEFEEERSLNLSIIWAVEQNVRMHDLDYCIADHGGRSPYLYLANLQGLPPGHEHQAKKLLAKILVPERYHDLLDLSNLGKTLIPIIGLPHWKPKYHGAVHRIIRGRPLEEHFNPIGSLLADFERPRPKTVDDQDGECQRIKSAVRLSDVLKKYGMDVSRNPTKCLWHESKGGQCFSFDDRKGLWYCFHCTKSGNSFQFIMEQEGCSFVEAKEKAKRFL
jgi:hypothetical protein